MTLIDTAEAIAGRRDKVFLVTKVLPWTATKAGTIAACEQLSDLDRASTRKVPWETL